MLRFLRIAMTAVFVAAAAALVYFTLVATESVPAAAAVMDEQTQFDSALADTERGIETLLSAPEEDESEKAPLFLPDEGAIPATRGGEKLADGAMIFETDEPSVIDAPAKNVTDGIAVHTIRSEDELIDQGGANPDISGVKALDDDISARRDGTPEILIVHTHGSESYEGGGTVVDVGDALAKKLTSLGFGVVHERGIYDTEFRVAYKSVLPAIESALEKAPKIKYVIDLHRDSMSDADGTRYKLLSDTGAAQVMLVVGSDVCGLPNPLWEHNLGFALRLRESMVKTDASLARPVLISKNRYNQHVRQCAVILEVGTDANTLAEAKAGAEEFAESFAAAVK